MEMNPIALVTRITLEDRELDRKLTVLYCSSCRVFHPARCFHRDRRISRQHRYVLQDGAELHRPIAREAKTGLHVRHARESAHGLIRQETARLKAIAKSEREEQTK